MNFLIKVLFFLLFTFQCEIFCRDIEKSVPNIDFNLFNGNKTSIDELLNEGILVLQFWAIWCSPCKKEMYHLNKIQKKFKDRGVNIVCVNTDNLKLVSKAKTHIKQKKYNFIVASDPSSQIFKKLNASVMPTTIIIDKSGKVVFRKEGYIIGDEKIIEEQLSLLINKS